MVIRKASIFLSLFLGVLSCLTSYAVTLEQARKILGIHENATETQAKSAFRKLIAQWHPDRNPGSRVAEEKSKDINQAWGVVEKSFQRRTQHEVDQRAQSEADQMRKAQSEAERRTRAQRDAQKVESLAQHFEVVFRASGMKGLLSVGPQRFDITQRIDFSILHIQTQALNVFYKRFEPTILNVSRLEELLELHYFLAEPALILSAVEKVQSAEEYLEVLDTVAGSKNPAYPSAVLFSGDRTFLDRLNLSSLTFVAKALGVSFPQEVNQKKRSLEVVFKFWQTYGAHFAEATKRDHSYSDDQRRELTRLLGVQFKILKNAVKSYESRGLYAAAEVAPWREALESLDNFIATLKGHVPLLSRCVRALTGVFN